MYRQVGPLQMDSNGLATQGVLVRHLVLPMDIADSEKVIDMVAEAAPKSAINVMGQYRPCYRASEFPRLLAVPCKKEVQRLREHASGRGLVRVD